MHKTKHAIGVFDSGLGGLSVVKTISMLLPYEDIIYYGDSNHAPYGTKTKTDVKALSHVCVNQLLSHHVKAIVIACNTATSAAAISLRHAYNIPIIGMEPALKPAVDYYPNGKILVLATKMTLKESKFTKLLNQHKGSADITLIPAGEFVTLVEHYTITQEAVNQILDKYISDTHYDAIVLGCTHFIFLKDYIDAYFKHSAVILDGNAGTAKHLKQRLMVDSLLSTNQSAGKITILNSAGEHMIKKSNHLLKVLA